MRFILGLGAIHLGVSLVLRCVSQQACVHNLGLGKFIFHLCHAVRHSERVCTFRFGEFTGKDYDGL